MAEIRSASLTAKDPALWERVVSGDAIVHYISPNGRVRTELDAFYEEKQGSIVFTGEVLGKDMEVYIYITPNTDLTIYTREEYEVLAKQLELTKSE